MNVKLCFPSFFHRGFLDVARILLTKVDDRNITNNRKRTPLHYAARDGHADIVHLLLEKGVEIDYRVSYLEKNVSWQETGKVDREIFN